MNSITELLDLEDALFHIDLNLQEYRELKEKYVQFNARNSEKPLEARRELTELVQIYKNSKHEIFIDFASLLIKYEYI